PTCTRAIRIRTAPTATALARYQNTSNLLLSQSQGWNLIRFATRKTRLKGAISRRMRLRSASGLSSASRSNGMNSPVFLTQNQGGEAAHATQPDNTRGQGSHGGT